MRAMEKLFMSIVCFTLISCAGAPREMAGSTNGKTYFTQANIWYEKPEKIYSTNYHVGIIIPVGTKVQIVRLTNEAIKFQPLDSEMAFTMTHVLKYSTIAFEEFFARYFSRENPLAEDGKFHQFTAEEQKNIKKGKIAVGMRKEAVLMAYGYPPTHATPNLSTNAWTYWGNRFQKQLVTFDDDKVISITR